MLQREDPRKGRIRVRAMSGANLLLGLWCMAAPFVLCYRGIRIAVINDVAIGAMISLIALIRVSRPLRSESASWLNFLAGIWLVAAPWILDYAAQPGSSSQAARSASWNDVIVGIAVAWLAIWSVAAAQFARRGPAAPVPF
jgi:hypothetical protein